MHTDVVKSWIAPGVGAALLAAGLFGAGTPFAKLLLAQMNPWLLAGLLYAGSGCGLWLWRRARRAPAVHLPRADLPWLVGAIAAGGVVAPVLLLWGLAGTRASTASLLLNAESVFTALLAWFAFKENVDRRIALGMILIVAGAVALTWSTGPQAAFAVSAPAVAILAACFAWGLDNNLTRKISLVDATWVAMVKGLVAGATNLALAWMLGTTLPQPLPAFAALVLGFVCYGASLTLFVVALRHLGSARTAAYFSVAPFFGAILSLVVLGETPTFPLLAAGVLMGAGVFLHLTERHVHAHAHEATEHEHLHVHGADPHHDHRHDPPVPPGTRHSHRHVHPPTTHSHAHFPDAHHLHTH